MSNNEPKSSAGDQSRRAFIRTTATAAAAVASTNIFRTPVYGQNTAPSAGKVLGANDRIVVGYIGVGGQGMAHVKQMKTHASANNVAQVAVCDVWEKRRNSSKAFIEKDSSNSQVEMFSDHRKLLERKDIDAVVIATHDIWHTKCAVDAMSAGKHVYVEKPCAHNIREGQSIAVMGFPIGGVLGFKPVTHRGIISAITPIALPMPASRQLNEATVQRLRTGTFDVYQLDATAYPGNSGGPVLDVDTGAVIGVISMVLIKGTKESALTNPSGISYAMPSSYVEALLKTR